MSAGRAEVGPATAAADVEPLADGPYRSAAVDRWPRVAMAVAAVALVASAVVVGGDGLTLGLVLGGAAVLFAVRLLLLRPHVQADADGLRLVGLLRTRRVRWADVAGAGARPVAGPLSAVEQCLVVHERTGAARRVRVVRGPVDAGSGVAPRVVELAAALVARAEREQGLVAAPPPPAAPETVVQVGPPSAVVLLLAHLATHGLLVTSAPGAVGPRPVPVGRGSDSTVVGLGALLRRLHDATAGWHPPPDACWGVAPRAPAEVVLHGDVSLDNALWEGTRVVGLVAWDRAHPGPRLVDVAHAAYRFVPLTSPTNPDAPGDLAAQLRRLPLLVAAYGMTDAAGLVEEVRDQLGVLAETSPDAAVYRADLVWLAEHGEQLQVALG